MPSGPKKNWSLPPFEPVIKDGMLHGRGADDLDTLSQIYEEILVELLA